MNINWSIRFKNKTWLVTFLTCIIAFGYQVLGMFDIVPPVSEDMAGQLIALAANVLMAAGVLIDPTTQGASDSERALAYTEPQ